MSASFFTQPRLDSFVNDAASGRVVRRTEYSGTLWVDGPIDYRGMFMTTNVSRRKPRVTSAILPDSLTYLDATATIVVHAWILGPGDLYIMSTDAGLTPSLSNAGRFAIDLTLTHGGSVPASFGYRVIVDTDPAHVDPQSGGLLPPTGSGR
ncbi:MAG: hypothetical protein R2719_03875 [Micropruina sp.]